MTNAVLRAAIRVFACLSVSVTHAQDGEAAARVFPGGVQPFTETWTEILSRDQPVTRAECIRNPRTPT